jgi:hypothetical protein
MKFKTDGCKAGDFIAVPLKHGGWAVALVVRVVPYVSGRPPHAIYTYGFGKLFESCPTIEEAMRLRMTDTVCLDYSSGYQVWTGAWPRLGALPGFSRRDWPIPPRAGTAGMGYSPRGEELVVHVRFESDGTSDVLWDSTESFILYDEYCQLPHLKGLGDAAGLSASLDMALHEQHPWHYYPVTEERLAIWKRVMDRIIKHKPELAAVMGPWYTGIEVPEAGEEAPQPAPKTRARTKKPTADEASPSKPAGAKTTRTRRAKAQD